MSKTFHRGYIATDGDGYYIISTLCALELIGSEVDSKILKNEFIIFFDKKVNCDNCIKSKYWGIIDE